MSLQLNQLTTEEQMAWLAGVLEGEGCFAIVSKIPLITITMGDRDIIENVEKVMKSTSKMMEIEPKTANRKKMFRTQIYGHQVIELLPKIYEHMGERRRSKIDELLQWEPKNRKEEDCINDVCGHLDRPYLAKGMCQQCYVADYQNGYANDYRNNYRVFRSNESLTLDLEL